MSGLVVETHDLTTSLPCDVKTTCSDDGEVWIELTAPGDFAVGMDWDDFRLIIDFIAIHSLGMHEPALVESSEIKEGVWTR